MCCIFDCPLVNAIAFQIPLDIHVFFSFFTSSLVFFYLRFIRLGNFIRIFIIDFNLTLTVMVYRVALLCSLYRLFWLIVLVVVVLGDWDGFGFGFGYGYGYGFICIAIYISSTISGVLRLLFLIGSGLWCWL